MRRGGPLRVAVLAAVAVPWLAGCSLLGFPPYFPGDYEDYPEPSIVSTYTTGSATLELEDGTLIELDRVASGSVFDAASGASIRWTGPDGWHLMVYGAGADDSYGSWEYLQLDKVVDSQHWTIWDENSCAIDVDRADETRVTGAATCRGLQWTDALAMPWATEPEPIEGEPEFDAEITFDARSEGASTSG